MAEAFLFDDCTPVFQPNKNINDIWSRWKEQSSFEVQSFIPQITKSENTIRKNRWPPWFKNSIRQLVRTKNRLFKRARSSGLSKHWELHRTARNQTVNAIKVAKAQYFHRIANSLADRNCPPSKWWSQVRSICGLKDYPPNVIPPLQDKSGTMICDDQEKANVLNDTFINQNVFQALDKFPFGSTNCKSTFKLEEISATDVRKILSSLHNKNSTGPDWISYPLLKKLVQES